MIGKTFAMIFMVLLAMIGIGAASFEVAFINPLDGAIVHVGDVVKIRTMSVATDEDNVFARLLIDGVPARTSKWIPLVPGDYFLEAQLDSTRDFLDPTSAFATVTVI